MIKKSFITGSVILILFVGWKYTTYKSKKDSLINCNEELLNKVPILLLNKEYESVYDKASFINLKYKNDYKIDSINEVFIKYSNSNIKGTILKTPKGIEEVSLIRKDFPKVFLGKANYDVLKEVYFSKPNELDFISFISNKNTKLINLLAIKCLIMPHFDDNYYFLQNSKDMCAVIFSQSNDTCVCILHTSFGNYTIFHEGDQINKFIEFIKTFELSPVFYD